jgi:hypothetical protein
MALTFGGHAPEVLLHETLGSVFIALSKSVDELRVLVEGVGCDVVELPHRLGVRDRVAFPYPPQVPGDKRWSAGLGDDRMKLAAAFGQL